MSPEPREPATPAEAAALKAQQAARPGGPCEGGVHCPHPEPDPTCRKGFGERRMIQICCRCGSRT